MIKDLEADLVQKLQTQMKPKSRLYLIMYDTQTGAVLEVSQSLQQDFGIRASTLHGQTAGTMNLQQLSPQLLDMDRQAALRSKSGSPIVFDTSSLRDTNFWMGDQEDDLGANFLKIEDKNKHANHSRSLSQDGIAHEGIRNVFHRGSCQAWICFTQIVENREFACVRFIELGEETTQEVNLEETVSSCESMGRPFVREEMSSDDESDHQLSQIKNFRTVLNNNSSSKAIAYIRWIISVVAVLYLGLFSFVKWLTVDDQSRIQDLTLLYVNMARRNWLLPDTASRGRLFEMTAK